ncbi:sensor histidine kinase [Paenibacillus sp. J31TS4]|uniref:sensor histidine kinase n=1 Tax=Paenibacillus sp. J31TS4 TaxID=2807195 RepID=UPI001B1F8FB8|nr:sensor histidine kinase [Paenibacillus sp. J31TS4]GIP40520.1 sensor histidine kinase [Paenibacillus sp. J31TS4]
MGTPSFLERLSLKKQLIVTFLLIMALSIVMTVVTLALGAWWLFHKQWVNPADHYDRQIPAIEETVRQQGDALLSPEGRTALETVLPADGMPYQVLDREGRVLYGTLQGPVFGSKQELAAQLNRVAITDAGPLRFGGTITRVLPVLSPSGDWAGTLVLQYKMEVTSTGRAAPALTIALELLLFASPFLYIALFTYLFAARLGRRINKPVGELMEAAARIKRQDLDFRIAYRASNEIGMLTESFEEMRSELKRSLLREWKLEQERRDLLDAVTHDLRTPVTVIQGHVELLAEEEAPDAGELRQHLKVIDQNVKRVRRLIEDFQIAAEKQFDSFPLQTEEVDPYAFAAAREQEISALCAAREAVCSFTLEDRRERPDVPVRLDVQRIGQVLDNLVTNSLRFVPWGGKVEVRLLFTDGRMGFDVADSGPGFAERDLPHVFDRFYSGQGGQSGLGLYTARLIVGKHGGTIRASNRPEGGARVCFEVQTTL